MSPAKKGILREKGPAYGLSALNLSVKQGCTIYHPTVGMMARLARAQA